jgi:oxalate---CoA ligase
VVEPPYPTIAGLLHRQATRFPDAPALLRPGAPPLTYAALRQGTSAMALALRSRGVTKQTRVAVVLPNGPDMAVAFLAVASCSVCAPLNPGYRDAEFRFYLEDTRAEAIVLSGDDRGAARAVAEKMGLMIVEVDAAFTLRAASQPLQPEVASGQQVDPGFPAPPDVALILHTSGTTARPKIVPLSHANLIGSAGNIASHLALQPDDRCLNVMPLFHIHGLVGALLAALHAGGSVVCTAGFDEDAFFDRVREFLPSWYTAVPAIHQRIVAHGDAYRRTAPTHRFRFVRSSSSALPPSVCLELEALTGAPVVEAYGMTEASHQMTSNPLPPRTRKPGSVGVPAGAEVAIVDEGGRPLPAGETGEIVVRGTGVTTGYENDPEANAKAYVDGWFRTGDQGRLDDDNYLFISGRLKEIVNRGGEKVSPREVDEALLEHADVAQATAFGCPHPTLGEDLVAAVVPKIGRHPEESALREHLFARLADFKVPSQIVFVDEIPKGPTGKVQRTSLHETLGHALARPFVAPRTETEGSVEAIFREVLNSPPLGVHENFFGVGGDSLKATQVMGRVNKCFSLHLPIVALFRHPRVAELALAIDTASRAAADRETALRSEVDALSDEEVARLLEELQRGDPTSPGAQGSR